MIGMSASGTSVVIVTLYEKCKNLVNPYFTWKIKRKESLEEIIFYQTDVSPDPYYFNEFNLTVATSSIDLLNGLIPVYADEWNYTIYEMISPGDLNLNNSQGIVEVGILRVGATFSVLPSYDTTQRPIVIYEG